jgi:hypothetical protein
MCFSALSSDSTASSKRGRRSSVSGVGKFAVLDATAVQGLPGEAEQFGGFATF